MYAADVLTVKDDEGVKIRFLSKRKRNANVHEVANLFKTLRRKKKKKSKDFNKIAKLVIKGANDRDNAKQNNNTPSFILFLDNKFGLEDLQPTMGPYVNCAHIAGLCDGKYHIIIANDNASFVQLSKEATVQNVELDLNKITCLPSIDSYSDIQQIISSIGGNISLCYISSHGCDDGLYGYWDKTTQPSILSEKNISNLATIINEKKAADGQIFLNSCCGLSTARKLANKMKNTIVSGATGDIITGTVIHEFTHETHTGRLCSTFRSTVPDYQILSTYSPHIHVN